MSLPINIKKFVIISSLLFSRFFLRYLLGNLKKGDKNNTIGFNLYFYNFKFPDKYLRLFYFSLKFDIIVLKKICPYFLFFLLKYSYDNSATIADTKNIIIPNSVHVELKFIIIVIRS